MEFLYVVRCVFGSNVKDSIVFVFVFMFFLGDSLENNIRFFCSESRENYLGKMRGRY